MLLQHSRTESMLSDSQTTQHNTSVSSQPVSANTNNIPEADATYNNYEEEDLYPETFTGNYLFKSSHLQSWLYVTQ